MKTKLIHSLLIFFILVIAYNCISQNSLEIDSYLVGYGYADECHNDSIEDYFIQIILKNISTETQYPWIMNCSWFDNFTIKPNEYEFCWFGCDRNLLEQFELKPGQKITFNGIISSTNPNYEVNDSIQIGFYLIEGNRKDFNFRINKLFILWKKIEEMQVDIWSKSVYLNNVNNKYEIK
jgi:hypothetical protein